jgi:hypothetical protein
VKTASVESVSVRRYRLLLPAENWYIGKTGEMSIDTTRRDDEATTPDHTEIAANYEETLEDFFCPQTVDLQRLAGEEILGEPIDLGDMARYITQCLHDRLNGLETDGNTQHDVADAVTSAIENLVLARYNDTDTPDGVHGFVTAFNPSGVYTRLMYDTEVDFSDVHPNDPEVIDVAVALALDETLAQLIRWAAEVEHVRQQNALQEIRQAVMREAYEADLDEATVKRNVQQALDQVAAHTEADR